MKMLCDASRAAADASANGSPCLGRRSLVTGLAALAATTTLASAAPSGRYDEAILYLHRKFNDLAGELAGSSDGKLQVMTFRRMADFATALSLMPAGHPSAVLAKRSVAAWSLHEGATTMRMPQEIVDALVSSAERDR